MTSSPSAGLESATRLCPMLSVRRGASAVEFYAAAFQARVLFRLDGGDGGVIARLSIDGAEFWVADESPGHANYSPESLGGSSARMILQVPDPDAVVARALGAGATLVWPVDDRHGWRIGRVVDPYGHPWEIGREIGPAP